MTCVKVEAIKKNGIKTLGTNQQGPKTNLLRFSD